MSFDRILVAHAPDGVPAEFSREIPHTLRFRLPGIPDPFTARWTVAAAHSMCGDILLGEAQPLLFPFDDFVPVPADTVSISTLQGGLLTRVLAGARIPLVQRMEWTWRPFGGCGPGSISLLSLDDVNWQIHRSRVTISLGGLRYYEGLVSDGPLSVQGRAGLPDELRREGYTFDLEGLGSLLDARFQGTGPIAVPEAELLIGGAIDYGAAFLDAARRFAPPAIEVSETQIDGHTGALQIDTIDLSRAGSLEALFKFYAEGSHSVYGVDEYGRLYLRPRSTTIQRILRAGGDFQDWNPRYNFDALFNRIDIRHKDVPANGGAGWIPGAWAEDATSIALYGRKQLVVQVPGHFPAALMQTLADALLADHREPIVYATIKGIPFEPRHSFYRDGLVRIISIPTTHHELVADCETLAVVSGPLLSAATIDRSIFYTGAASLRLQFPAGSRGLWIQVALDAAVDNLPFELLVWLRSAVDGARVVLGCGAADAFEVAMPLVLLARNSFQQYRLDLRGMEYRRLRFLGLRVEQDEAGTIHLDSAGIKRNGFRALDLHIDSVKYVWSAAEKSHEIQAGTVRRRWAQPVMNLLNLAQQMRLATEYEK